MAEESEVRVEEGIEAHAISVSVVQPALAEFDAGTDIALKIKASCSSGCDLRGGIVKIVAQDAAVVKAIELTLLDETAYLTEEFVVKAPLEPGVHTWTAVLRAQDDEGNTHPESSAPFSFTVNPHATSIAVWDVTSPAVLCTSSRLKVGVKCAVGCDLTGREVEVYDHEGARVAVGTLGSAPYSDAVDLHWTEVEFTTPDAEGCYNWQARLPKPDLGLAHQASSYAFSFTVVKPSECDLTVEVIDKETESPIKNAHVVVRPGMYHGHTDECGVTKIQVARGEYQLLVTARERAPKGIAYLCGDVLVFTKGKEDRVYVPEANKEDRKPFRTTVVLDNDMAVKVELVGVIEPLVPDTK